MLHAVVDDAEEPYDAARVPHLLGVDGLGLREINYENGINIVVFVVWVGNIASGFKIKHLLVLCLSLRLFEKRDMNK